jgi:hypothetical protein
MGARVLGFSRANVDPSPGYTAALSRLEDLQVRAEQVAEQQRHGITVSRVASAKKHELRRLMRRTQLSHIAAVADAASKSLPELAQNFVLASEDLPYSAFRTAARGMAAEARSRKEFLVLHGLTDTVLDSLGEKLDEFDKAVQQGNEGRREHVGASAELDALAEEIVQVVRIMDGLNRYRFAGNAELLAAWESACNTFGPARPEKPVPEDDVEPAA